VTLPTDWLIRVRLTVRFRDCDPYGHVNNAVYLTYLENSRFALWKAQDINGVILARAEVDYRAQAKYGDVLEVRTRLVGLGRSSFQYEYEIRDVASDATILIAKTVQVRFDYDTQRPVEMSDDFKARLQTPVEQIWQS
jgi:acyl-CoA thioester hydrolase